CFGSYLEDSTASILSAHSEVGIMTKMGGGTSGYFGNLRGRGAPIGQDKGESFGSVHFMEMFDNLVKVISQGKVRRGAFSPYLPIEHPDALEFIKIGSEGHPIQGLTHGVTVTNSFIEKLYEGDGEARTKWAEVIKARGERGYPYILFLDNINDNTVDVYKDKNRKIVASNLCVAPETKVLTSEGYCRIEDLKGRYVSVWNGNEFSMVKVVKTGEDQPLVKVIT